MDLSWSLRGTGTRFNRPLGSDLRRVEHRLGGARGKAYVPSSCAPRRRFALTAAAPAAVVPAVVAEVARPLARQGVAPAALRRVPIRVPRCAGSEAAFEARVVLGGRHAVVMMVDVLCDGWQAPLIASFGQRPGGSTSEQRATLHDLPASGSGYRTRTVGQRLRLGSDQTHTSSSVGPAAHRAGRCGLVDALRSRHEQLGPRRSDCGRPVAVEPHPKWLLDNDGGTRDSS